MKVIFDPENAQGTTGVVSFASWNNPDLQKAIREAFHESPGEEIVEIFVRKDGITALFHLKESAPLPPGP